MNKEVLISHGIDYEKGIQRCLDDEKFYEMILGMFLKDTSFERSRKAFEAKDYDMLFNTTHELKGVCGNADIKALYDEVCPLVELLRHKTGTEEEIDSQFKKVEEAYEKIKEGIEMATISDEG